MTSALFYFELKLFSMASKEDSGDYGDYYRRIQKMGKDKGWKEDEINQALKDREWGEKQYTIVSSRFAIIGDSVDEQELKAQKGGASGRAKVCRGCRKEEVPQGQDAEGKGAGRAAIGSGNVEYALAELRSEPGQEHRGVCC